MPSKPIPTDLFRKFLKSIGLKKIRTTDHEVWDRPDNTLSRPIIFRAQKKEIPDFHIRTNLKTLGMTYKQFEEIISSL